MCRRLLEKLEGTHFQAGVIRERIEADDDTAAYYDSWIQSDYRALGYQLIRVPVLPPKERLAFVLERLSANKDGYNSPG